MTITVENGLLRAETKNFNLNNINPKVFYPGSSYNTLEQGVHGEWRVEKNKEGTRVFCDNFALTFKEEDGFLFFKGEYSNDTSEEIKDISSFELLRCEWDSEIVNAFCNIPTGYNGVSCAEMQSPVKKRILCADEYAESADFIVFGEGNGRTSVFGACTFNDFFSEVYVNRQGYIIASALTERRNLLPGEKIVTDLFCIMRSDADYYGVIDKYTEKVADFMHARKIGEPFCGFCTWYYYGPGISEKSVLKDLDCVCKRKNEIPYRLFQIDDGWFLRRGDFVENDKFVSMKGIADKIKDQNLIPGIWVDPHAVAKDSDIYQNHKDWLVKDCDGEIHSSLALDFSHPEVKKWLYDLFKKLTEEWGFKYIKVDLITPVMCVGKYYDPTFNSLKNYRESFKIMREAVGDDVFLLACTAPIMASVGLADGIRTSIDIGERYNSLLSLFGQSLNRTYINSRLIMNDSDCLLVRKPENEDGECFRNCVRNDEEIKTYLTALIAVGGPLIHSDKLSLLTDEQFKLISNAFPLPGAAKSLDFMFESIPRSLDFGRHGNLEVIAFINWGERRFEKFDLQKKGHVFEFWQKKYYGYSEGNMKISVPAHGVKVFTISNGNGIVPIGVDDALVPPLSWDYDGDDVKITPVKPGEGVYVYSQNGIAADCGVEKISENVYFVKCDKGLDRISIKQDRTE